MRDSRTHITGPWVRSLFDRISSRYDLFNDVLSLGIHRLWKRRAVDLHGSVAGAAVLDAATGTGDLAHDLALRGATVTAIDFSEGMLGIARHRRSHENIEFLLADAQSLPFADAEFDHAIVAFGVRNFEDPARGMTELWRVLKPQGRLVVLEFGDWMRLGVFGALTRRLALLIGADPEAYDHLAASSSTFPSGAAFVDSLCSPLPGAVCAPPQRLFFGVAHLYCATKTTSLAVQTHLQ